MKKTTTFACAFALALCYLFSSAAFAEPQVPDHPWLKRVAVAIGPINPVAEVDPELAKDLKQWTRETFEEIYQGSNPPVVVDAVIEPVFVEPANPLAPAMILMRAQPFIVIAEDADRCFIAQAPVSPVEAWGLIYVVGPKQQRVYLLIANLRALPRNEERS